jgi:hypothetical protein
MRNLYPISSKPLDFVAPIPIELGTYVRPLRKTSEMALPP